MAANANRVPGWGRSRLMPRVLPLLGFIGALLLVANTIFTMFGISGPLFTLSAIGVLPIALWEFSLGVWLTVKGFNPSAITTLTEGTINEVMSVA